LSAAPSAEALLQQLETYGVRLGLERMQRLLGALGEPQLSYPTVIVGGTNGKGSTAALLASMCRAAGLETGLYVSPHLEDVRERIRTDGRAIAESDLTAYLQRTLDLAAEVRDEPPTYFEALTLAAFQHFRTRKVDLAILEVGLGGRLDATNAAEPELSIITRIALDHEAQLGPTLESITREKAGILRPEKPAVVWGGHPEVRAVLDLEAFRIGAELVFVAERVALSSIAESDPMQRIELETPRGHYILELALAGEHQWRNLATAVIAAETLAAKGWKALDRRAIAEGSAACRWPGRLEWVDLPGGRRILLDVAHNPDGIEVLSHYLEQRGERYDLLFGAFVDKRVEAMLPRIAAAAGRIVLTTPPGSRSADPRSWRRYAGAGAEVAEDLPTALERALAEGDDTLVICGSLYLVGEVRRLLRERFGVPASALGEVEDPALQSSSS